MMAHAKPSWIHGTGLIPVLLPSQADLDILLLIATHQFRPVELRRKIIINTTDGPLVDIFYVNR